MSEKCRLVSETIKDERLDSVIRGILVTVGIGRRRRSYIYYILYSGPQMKVASSFAGKSIEDLMHAHEYGVQSNASR